MIEPQRGEIWLADLSPTKGHEQSGKRPVLIISDDLLNKSAADLCIILPLTSKIKGIPSHIPLKPPEGGVKVPCVIMGEAIRSISRERLEIYWGNVSGETMGNVENVVNFLLGLK